MTYQVDVLLHSTLYLYYPILGDDLKILLANQFAGFFTFGLFDLLNLKLGSIATLYLFWMT